MEFRLKGILNLDGALTGAMAAAEMKVAISTAIATSAMVVSGIDVEVKNTSAVKIEIQQSQMNSNSTKTKTSAEQMYVAVGFQDQAEPVSFPENTQIYDSEIRTTLTTPTVTQITPSFSNNLPTNAYSNTSSGSSSRTNYKRSNSNNTSSARRSTPPPSSNSSLTNRDASSPARNISESPSDRPNTATPSPETKKSNQQPSTTPTDSIVTGLPSSTLTSNNTGNSTGSNGSSNPGSSGSSGSSTPPSPTSNNKPVASAACTTTGTQDTPYACAPTVTDIDATDVHFWTLAASNTCLWASINATSGAINGTPNDDEVGSCTLAFKVNDGTDDSDTVSNNITISNIAPTLSISNASAVSEDAASGFIQVDGQVQASEEGFGVYSFEHATTTAPKCSDNSISLSIDSTNGSITFQPSSNYNGTCNIKVLFDDGNGSSVSDEFSITVNAVNDAPVIAATCDTSLNQDAAFGCSTAPNVTEPDGDTVTWSLDASHDCAWLSVNGATGALTGTPNDDDVGSCTLAFKANDGTVDSNILSQTVTVNNLAPTLTIADAAAININHAVLAVRTDANVQANEEGFGTYSLQNGTTTAPKCSDNANRLLIHGANGFVGFEPSLNYTGTCNIKVAFDDGNGGVVEDEFSITVAPASPTIDLNLTDCGSFPTELSVSRGSSGTYFDNTGTMQTAAVNTPRCDHDPLSTTAKGLLIEEARTNYALGSKELDGGEWARIPLVSSADTDVATAPDGTLTAERINDDSGILPGTIIQIESGIASDSEIWTCSIFVKRDAANAPSNESSAMNCALSGGTLVSETLVVDWNTQTVSTVSPAYGHGIQHIGNGWYRIWISIENNTTGNDDLTITVYPSMDGTFGGGPTGSIFAWGMQAEVGPAPSSFIPTNATAVTRAADNVNFNSVAFYNLTNGSFASEASIDQVTSTLSRRVYDFNNGANVDTNAGFITISNNFTSKVRVASSATSNIVGAASPTAGASFKLGATYSTTQTLLSVNGSNDGSSSASTLPSTVTDGLLGRNSLGSYLNGHIKNFKYWNYPLSSSGIDLATSP